MHVYTFTTTEGAVLFAARVEEHAAKTTKVGLMASLVLASIAGMAREWVRSRSYKRKELQASLEGMLPRVSTIPGAVPYGEGVLAAMKGEGPASAADAIGSIVRNVGAERRWQQDLAAAMKAHDSGAIGRLMNAPVRKAASPRNTGSNDARAKHTERRRKMVAPQYGVQLKQRAVAC